MRRPLALAVALGLAACAHSTPPKAQATAAAPAPSRGIGKAFPIGITANRVGGRYVYLRKLKGLRKIYVLRADKETGRYFGQDTGRSTFTNPHVTFYGQSNKRLVADAPTGTVVEKDKTVRMSGGVRARSSDGLTLRSDTLAYDDERDLVHGVGNVTVTSPQGEELQGETLDWNLRDGAIVVAGAHER